MEMAGAGGAGAGEKEGLGMVAPRPNGVKSES